MKKLIFLSLLAFAATACNDDDGPEAPYYTGRTDPLVSTATEINGAEKITSDYFYDSNGRITHLAKGSRQDGKNIWTSNYTITYNSDRVAIDQEYNDLNYKEFNYTQHTDILLNRQGRMISATSERIKSESKIRSIQTAKYDTDNRLTHTFSETKIYGLENEVYQVDTIDTSYTWADGKIVSSSRTHTTQYDKVARTAKKIESTFTYSDIKNSTFMTFVENPIEQELENPIEQELGLLGDLSPYLLEKTDAKIIYSPVSITTRTNTITGQSNAQGYISEVSVATIDGYNRKTWEFTYKN